MFVLFHQYNILLRLGKHQLVLHQFLLHIFLKYHLFLDYIQDLLLIVDYIYNILHLLHDLLFIIINCVVKFVHSPYNNCNLSTHIINIILSFYFISCMLKYSFRESPSIAFLRCPTCNGPLGFADVCSKRILSSFLVVHHNFYQYNLLLLL